MSLLFEGDLSVWQGALMALVFAVGVWWLYRQDVVPGRRLAWLLPVLRMATIILIVLMLTGPVVRQQVQIGDLSRVLIFLDESQSMGLSDESMTKQRKIENCIRLGLLHRSVLHDLAKDSKPQREIESALSKLDKLNRWQRVERSLLGTTDPLLSSLASQHQVTLMTTSEQEELKRLWVGTDLATVPEQLDPEKPGNPMTDLVAGIQQSIGRHQSKQKLAIVLVSDGQHNSVQGERGSPLHLARLASKRGVPIFTVGVGASRPPSDLAVMTVQAPQSVFADDRLKGTILVKDDMAPGQPFVLKIKSGDETVWTKQLTTTNSHGRTVEFDFPIKGLAALQVADGHSKALSVPLAFKVQIEPADGEVRDDNNERALFVRAMTRPRRLLILDGRPRWEFRYMRNLFERDKKWEVNDVLPAFDEDAGLVLPRGSRLHEFPADRKTLFAYDLIVLGEMPREVFRAEELKWLREFVADRAGGLILIDGQRGKLRQYAESRLGALLPVKWTGVHADGPIVKNLVLSDQGRNTPAMQISAGIESLSDVWAALPPPRWLAPVEAQPGCEVLLQADLRGENGKAAALVQRRFGAGRVVYAAFDESWRWRYEVADRYHQRYWNQLATWVMESPYAVHNRHVSIDTGGVTYQKGRPVDLRVRLRDERGLPVVNADVEAVLYQDDQDKPYAQVQLKADENAGGVFRGSTDNLPPGSYRVGVRAAGFTKKQLDAQAEFVVLSNDGGEMNVLTCDEDLLQQMAELSGGKYLREEDMGQLSDVLEPLSDGRIEQREYALWRSWFWFLPLVALFTGEWILRRKAGLL